MKSLGDYGAADYLHHYVLTRWKTILGASAMNLVVTVLSAVSLGLLAAVPQLILRGFGDEALSAKALPGPGNVQFSLDIADIVSALTVVTEGLVNQYGIIGSLVTLAGLYLVVAVATRAIQLYSDYLLILGKTDAARQATKDVFGHLCNLSLDFFHRHKVGDLTTRIKGESGGLAHLAFDAVGLLVGALPLFLFYWGVLIVTNWQLTAIAVVIVGARFAASWYVGRHIRDFIRQFGSIGGESASKLTEVLSGILAVKVFGKEEDEKVSYGELVDMQTEKQVKRTLFVQVDQGVQSILSGISTIVIATVGAIMLLTGSIELVTLLVYFIVALRTQDPTQKVFRFVIAFHIAWGMSVRVFEIIRESANVQDGRLDARQFRSAIDFDDVSFRYREDEPALRHVRLTIRKGEVVALVGPSGSGKTSLVNLLLRFHDPDEGRILIDGVDVRDYSQDSYRRLFGVVTQEPILFNASIRENIAYAAPGGDVADEVVIEAARIAHVDEFVDKWDDSYDTQIGDRGVLLSGGQKQRVTLARAILRNPQVLVLDEATSSLDSHSEQLIQSAIEEFLEGRTAIIVAHRLSTIRKADRIIVMDKGRIVEEGTHDELMNEGGSYFKLYDAQVRENSDRANQLIEMS